MANVTLPHIILASASPRRRELIARLGVTFTVQPTATDEEALEAVFAGPPEDLALYLAGHKAEAALRGVDANADAVLAADTTVIIDGLVLGKPRDAAEAHAMLTRLRGRTHVVTTGVALVVTQSGQRYLRAASTPVTMRNYSDDEIAAYIATGDPFDKAGSYAIQHPIFQPVARIDGCATNVIGLPLCTVADLLATAGLLPANPAPRDGVCPWDARCHPARADERAPA